MATKTSVELGFVEKVESWQLSSHYFPSKVGGKPAWLSLQHIPAVEQLTCKYCQKPCTFMLQVYCPLGDKVDCFHRTLFIFMCKSPKCCEQKSFHVFRSQLPRINPYFSEHPPEDSKRPSKDSEAGAFQNLCIVCGCPGNKKCGKCKSTSYCSKDHQIIDWKSNHKRQCGRSVEDDECTGSHYKGTFLFPEFEIVTEQEELDETQEKTEEEKLAEFKTLKDKIKCSIPDDDTDNRDLDAMAKSEDRDDKIFLAFQERIRSDPDQVLRYDIDGNPLLVSDHNKPRQEDIPLCQCGKPRRFEFQVMPQLLNYLNVDSLEASIDWGTLLIYTCSDSCPPPADAPYVPEFLWKQDFTNSDCAK